MGEVFLAEDLASPGSEVALKVLQADALAEGGEDLRVEFGNMTRLRHPNLVAVREFGIIDGSGTPFLTMEHVAGGSLRDAPLPLPPEIVTDVLTQVCRALDYIHARDILHHDLKPGNLLVAGTLGEGGVVKLADFGLASAAGRTASLDRGTPVYMAPERFTSERVDRRADLYSLGAVLFHLLMGRPPFDPGPGLLDRILSGPPPVAAPPDEGLSRALHAVIQKLLSPRPGLRYPSAAAVIEAMNRLAGPGLRLDADPGRSLVRHAPLTGRDAELARVREWLAADPGAGPRMVVVRGETGMGKTRLIEEARAEAQLAGFEVIELDLASGASGPFGAWPAPLQRLARRLRAGGAPDELDGLTRDLAPLLTEQADPPAAPRRGRAAASAALLHLASTRFPLLLILEDLGAAGPTDLAVLRQLRRGSPVRVLASLRDDGEIPGEVLRFLAARTRSSQAVEIDLRPLDPEAQAGMVASILGMDSIPRALGQQVAAASGGNPLWIEESLRALIEDRVLVRAPEGWRLDSSGRNPVRRAPDAMAMARGRIEGLPETERELLELVAVGGGRATLDLLADLLGGEPAASLARLAERGILEVQPEPSGERVAFRHAVLQRTAYELCHAERRRTLHARFAARLEGDPTTPRDVLARHLVGAGDTGRGLDLLEEAAREAIRLHAHDRAIPLLGEALRIAPPPRKAALEEALAEAQEAVGANRRAMEALRRALQADPEPGAAARLLAKLGKNASLAGDYGAAVEAITEAAERFRVLEDRVGEAEAQKALGIAWARQNEFDRAEGCYRAALEIYRALEDRDGMASLRNNLGLLRSFRGDHAGAVRQLEKAMALRDATGDRRGRLGTLINLGFVRNRQHDHEAAAAVLEESVALAESIGDLQNLGNARMFLAESLRGQGRMDRACRQLEAALRVHQETGDDARQIDCHDRIGEIHRLLGDVATAAEHHRRALELARESHDPVQEAFALASLGLDRLGLGEPDALDDLRTALESGRSRSPRAEVRALRGLALAEAMRGRWSEMGSRADRLILVAETAGLSEDRAWGLRLLGEAQIGMGELEAGRGTLREAAVEARRLGRPELEREVLLLLSDSYHHGGRAGDALETRQRAREILEEMAMKIEDEGMRSSFRARANRPTSGAGIPDRDLTGGATPAAEEVPGARSLGLAAIYEISQTINSELDPNRLLETVMDLAIRKLDADRGLLILFDGPGREMRARVARNMEQETIDDALAYSRHVVQEAAEGRPVLSFDAAHDSRFKHFRSVRLHGIRSLLCVPLRLRGEVVGTVYLDSRRPGIAFDEADLRFLEVFANMAALALHNAREFDGLRRENRRLLEQAKGRFSYGNIVGKSPRMQSVFDIISKVTDSTLPVLICGESGTGKELVARAIHFNGPRKNAPFFAENCTAINETLLESELFGHVKGAFTGADANRAGLFELASGGTLFLDEIGDMSLGMQSKVLRALQEGEIRPVGGKRSIKVDVRILSATNHDVDRLLQEGRFREDLYFRLNVVKVHLPSLRDRKEDIPLLVDHFLSKHADDEGRPEKRMDVDALSLILRYDWPGNVRELENEVRKLAVFTEGDVITMDAVNRHRELFHKLTDLRQESSVESIEEVERKQIIRALQETGGHRGKAAQILGISRATIFRKIKQYAISS